MIRRAWAAAAVALLAGCAGMESDRYKTYPPNPYPDITTVAVLPIRNHALDVKFDGDEFASILASELVKFSGFRAIRAGQLRAALGPGEVLNLSAPDDVLKLGRRVKADALLVCSVTDYDPYDPPKIAVSVQFLRTSPRGMSGADIDRIVQSASWRQGPMPLGRDKAGHFVTAFEDVFDSHEERIRTELVKYAQAQEGTDSPWPAEREFLAVQPRFLQFVSNQVINHIFELTLVP